MILEIRSREDQKIGTYLQKNIPPRQEIDTSWLARYENRSDSIFKYYSIDNEVKFLKQRKEVPTEDKIYYLEENVKRFIGEFVGKVPYTTVPYTINPDGFDYGGMHVMDTYRKAAQLGEDREKAETDGFGRIESEFIKHYKGISPTAVWISPPKIADYGFVFLLTPQGNGNVKEYVLRYEEKRGELIRSKEIASNIDPHTFFDIKSTNEFLHTPTFIYSSSPQDSLQALLKTVGVSQAKINQSLRFEREIDKRLSSWIRAYSTIMINLSETPDNTAAYLDKTQQAKAILLSVYSHAQRIRDEINTHSYGSHDFIQPLPLEYLSRAFAHVQQNSPLVQGGGSCPVVESHNNTFPGDTQQRFLSNMDFFNALYKNTPLETKVTSENEKASSFPCPQCNRPIPSGEGRTSCPHCGLTKQKHAEKTGTTCA
ncbi:hypothetical protein HZC27_03545 [Candidatus Roizmanbacteria bacterium]|nr:hypothetical protein [Candidatus Roizmanbacteria bacterium]